MSRSQLVGWALMAFALGAILAILVAGCGQSSSQTQGTMSAEQACRTIDKKSKPKWPKKVKARRKATDLNCMDRVYKVGEIDKYGSGWKIDQD